MLHLNRLRLLPFGWSALSGSRVLRTPVRKPGQAIFCGAGDPVQLDSRGHAGSVRGRGHSPLTIGEIAPE